MTETGKENVVPLMSADKIEDEAATWQIALSGDDATAVDKEAFRQWLARSPRHREAYERLAALWDDMAALEVLEDHAASVADLVEPAAPSRRTMFAMAASVAIAVAASGVIYAAWSPAQTDTATYATRVGEQKTVALSDGSSVQLNTNSRIEVAYTKGRRKITLARGEAYFDVAKNKDRPFLVYANNGFVRAVGTAFTVRLRDRQAVEVTVEEGRVALAPDTRRASKPEQTHELAAGENATYAEKVGEVMQLPTTEINRRMSWRQGVLVYAGEPLSDVVADFSRYTNMQIEIADEEAALRKVGGVYKAGDVEEMLESLELNFGLTVERVGANHVRLTSAS